MQVLGPIRSGRWRGPIVAAAVAVLLAAGSVYAVQTGQRKGQVYPGRFRLYPGVEYTFFPLPPDANEKTELTPARLMYPAMVWYPRWTMDYPRSDRHLASAIRRLTRINVRSVEQVVNLDDPEVFNWPWMYAVEVGYWNLTDTQAARLRDYLLRGGFLMVDDFHGTREWENFMVSMRRVFPDRTVVEIESTDPIFHVIYDLDERYQVPGAQYLETGRPYEHDGYEARWRGIYDDKGRLMVAMCHNVDLGDAWEHADNPEFPEKYSALAFRIAANYVAYAMTH